jgi:hypothetical protein
MSDAHLSPTELVRWRDHGEGDRDRIVAHLAVCAVCRHAAANLERERPAEAAPARFAPGDFVPAGYRAGPRAPLPRPAMRAAYLATAAVIALAVLVVPMWLRQRSDPAFRGATVPVELNRPVASVVDVQELVFEWTAAPGIDRFRLTVVAIDQPSTPLIDRDVTGTRYAPTDEERKRLHAGQSLHWFVEYRGANGVTGTSPAVRFSLR